MAFETVIPAIRQMAWKPASSQAAVASADGLALVDAPSGAVEWVAFGSECASQSPASVDLVAWSPDGNALAAIVRQAGRAAVWVWQP